MSDSLFAIIAYDRSGSDKARSTHRDGHLAHFRSHADRISVAGPLSGSASGSLVIYQASNAAEARDFIEGDPFHAAGVWDRIEVLHFKAGSGKWAG